jgi:hypothetical protein
MLQADMKIEEIITQNRDTYEKMNNGTLFLSVTVAEQLYNACVTRTEDFDIFVIDECDEDI